MSPLNALTGNSEQKEMNGNSTIPNSFATKDEQLKGANGTEKTNYAETCFKGMPYLPPKNLTASGLLCGPLLRYCGTYYKGEEATWKGTILLVLVSEVPAPRCRVDGKDYEAQKIYEEKGRNYWRFNLVIGLEDKERKIEYTVNWDDDGAESYFWVQGRGETMRILFHSCNGFSVGTNTESYGGPALWNDVLRTQEHTPFHVMLGGGDQIYSDEVRVEGPLKEWSSIKNPEKRKKTQFTPELEYELECWYFMNYCRWYTHPPISRANRSIPQVNIWDDHDIIDGYGSYAHHFMKCDMFNGIGRVAFKYYLLFQHHTAPSEPDSEKTTGGEETDESWVIGPQNGIYIRQKPHSVMTRLGKEVLFFGIDARTERTRKQINRRETYDQMFEKLEEQVSQSKDIKHVLLLLGVPIAYPRMVWLEVLFASRLMGIFRFLNTKMPVMNAGFFNNFDGAVDLLDDLDDHYCAKHHKAERNELIHRLQDFAKKRSVRVSILSGDVHLAAVGRFYSNPKHKLSVLNDFRYMPNIISSAITNKPPPVLLAKFLAKRNRTHRLHHDTHEKLMPLFNVQPDDNPNKKNKNIVTMPHRNYCVITSTTPSSHESSVPQATYKPPANEIGAGTLHFVAGGKEGVDLGDQGLEIKICVEKEQGNLEGHTTAYGFTIPKLVVNDGVDGRNQAGGVTFNGTRLGKRERY